MYLKGFFFKYIEGIVAPLGKTCYKRRLGKTRVNSGLHSGNKLET